MALVAVVMLLASRGEAASGSDPAAPVNEVMVRAAFLMNIAKFVRWPDPSGPLVIAIAGDEALVAALSRIASGRSIDGRALSIQAIGVAETPPTYHLLYIGNLDDRDASALLGRVREGVLTVGSTPRFLRDGGIIRIFVDGGRMRFQVNHRRAVDAGLQVSSQVLSLSAQ
jgi:hypothetical protein